MSVTTPRTTRRTPVLECRMCGIGHPDGYHPVCERCGGPTDVFYDLATARVGPPGEPPTRRYADLLPLADPGAVPWAGEGGTPLVHARELGARYGLERLYLKCESANPTRTTKDRMATVALAFLRERGVREITVSSTGNSSTSFAAVAPYFPDMHVHVFCGEEFTHRLNFADTPNVTVRSVPGSFVQAGAAAAEFAAAHGLTFERGFFNPGRREGLKTAYLEAFDAMPEEPAVVVQAISSGMGLYGAHKGIAEYRAMGRLRRVPRIVCAQQASCAPMYRGWRDGAGVLDDRYVEHRPSGPAYAILRGDARATYPIMRRIVAGTGGCFTAAANEEIAAAAADARALEGIDVCPASAVALAGTARLAREGWITPGEPVLVNLTGAERPPGPRPAIDLYVPADAAAGPARRDGS